MRRPLRLVLVLALGVPAGCAADDSASHDPTTTTFTGGVATGFERDEIVDAYRGHWAPFYRYLNNNGGGEPIGNYFAGARRDDLPGQVAEVAGRGLEVRGEPDSQIRSVRVAGDLAQIVDCQIDGSFAVDASTSAMVIPPSTVPQLVHAELTHDDSGWKVSSVVYEADNSCER